MYAFLWASYQILGFRFRAVSLAAVSLGIIICMGLLVSWMANKCDKSNVPGDESHVPGDESNVSQMNQRCEAG